jgi:3-oxoisoapionate decarboxylase
MKLGISSYTYTWAVGLPGYPPEKPLRGVDLLEKAAALDITLVQVADNLPLDQMAPAELDRFEACAKTLGIEIEVGTRGIATEHLQTYLQLARRFESPILRVVIDTADYHPPEGEIVATLQGVMPDFEESGVTLAIENHDCFTAAALTRLLERVGSDNIGICLDTANSFGVLEGPQVVVETLAPWAVNLHLKDFVVSRADHTLGFVIQGCPVGQGRLDVPWLLAKLRDAGRDVNAIFEQWTVPEEALVDTIAKEDAWVRSSIAYMRRLLAQG